MNRLRAFLDTLAALLGRRRLEADLDEELRYHLDREAAKYVAEGMSPDAAARRAQVAFGAVATVRDEVREARGLGAGPGAWFTSLQTDLVQALRGLRRTPRFSLTVIGLLGLTLGAGVTLFGIVDALLLRPPAHVVDPDRVVRLVGRTVREDGTPFIVSGRSWVDFETLRDRSSATTDHAAWFATRMSLGRGAEARSILAVAVTPSFFRLLGVHPALGRFFTDEEDVRDAAAGPIVLGWDFWRGALGGETDVLGQELLVGTVTYTVIGVAPPGFTGMGQAPIDAWLPIQVGAGDLMGRYPELWNTDGSHWLQIAARLRPGVSRAQAGSDATTAYRTFTTRRRDPDLTATMLADPLIAGRGSEPGQNARVARWLGLGIAGILLLVTANLINLFLARNLTRRRETAVRLALGGSRSRIFRFLVTESLLLASLAGAAALMIVAWLGPLARVTLLPGVALGSSSLDLRIVVVGVGLAMLIGIVVAGVMTFQSGRIQPAQAFRGGGQQSTTSRGGQRARLVLVGVQAALSTTLLAASLGFLQSLRRATAVDLGMDVESVIVAQAPLDAAGYDRDRQQAFYRERYQELSTMPGIVSASLGYMNPWWNNRSEPIRLPGRDSVPTAPNFGSPAFDAVTPEYLRTLGMRMVAGRWIEPTDRAGSAPVVVVNQSLARLYWPGESPLGKCMYIGDDPQPCRTVVGMSADHRFTGGLDSPAIPAYFLPLEQSGSYGVVPRLFLRAGGNLDDALATIRRTLQGAATDLPVVSVRTLQSQLDPLLAPWRLGSYAFTAFGALATIIAMSGLFGVLAYLVTERSSEFAVRSALGARPVQIATPVVLQGLAVVGMGVGAGLGATGLLGRWLQPLLFQTRLAEPAVAVGIGTLLLVAALVACLGPARRASRNDPMEVLRS